MKKRLFLFPIIFFVLVSFFVSCPNGPDVPLSGITINVYSGVGKDASGTDDDSGDLFDDLIKEYKLYTTNTWSVDLRGTQREWTQISDNNIHNNGDDSFALAIKDVTPAVWTLEVRFKKDDEVVKYFKDTNVDITGGKSYNGAITLSDSAWAAINANKFGNIKITAKLDPGFNEVIKGYVNFNYRFNNSVRTFIGNEYDGMGIFEYNSKTENSIVDISSSEGNHLGYLTKIDDNTMEITLEYVPYGYYFYNIIYYYQTENVIETIRLAEESTKVIYLNKDNREVEVKLERSESALLDEEESIQESGNTITRFVNNQIEGTIEEVEISAVADKITFIPMLTGPNYTYTWSYRMINNNQLYTSSSTNFELDLTDISSSDRLRYDGTDIKLVTSIPQAGITEARTIETIIPLKVGHYFNIETQKENTEEGETKGKFLRVVDNVFYNEFVA